MELQQKSHLCGDRLDKKGGDQTGAPEPNNCLLKLKSPLYDADDSGYGELGVNGDLSDEHRFRRRRRSQNDDGCCEVDMWEPPYLGSSTPRNCDRPTLEQRYIQSPSTYDSGAEVLEIDLRKKHANSIVQRQNQTRSSPPFNAESTKPWFLDAVLSSPNCKGWFGRYDVRSGNIIPETTDTLNGNNVTPTETSHCTKRVIDDEKHLHPLNFSHFIKEKDAMYKKSLPSKDADGGSYRIIEIGKVSNKDVDPKGMGKPTEYANERLKVQLQAGALRNISRDANNNVEICNNDIVNEKYRQTPHETLEVRDKLNQETDKEPKSRDHYFDSSYNLCLRENNAKPTQTGLKTRLDIDKNEFDDKEEECRVPNLHTKTVETGQTSFKAFQTDINFGEDKHSSSHRTPPAWCSEDEHDLSDKDGDEHDHSDKDGDGHEHSDKDEKHVDDTDTASDIENDLKLSTSSSDGLPKYDPISPPKHIKRNKRKMYTPRKSADKADPTFRGVTMWFKTEFKNGDSDLQISACYSNVKAGCSPVTYPMCPVDPSVPDTYSYPEAEGHSPYHFIKMCASCRTRRTPLWRDAEDGTPLCNACGIRYKKYRLRCSKCWHIPKKEIQTYPNCPVCGASLRYSFHNRKTW